MATAWAGLAFRMRCRLAMLFAGDIHRGSMEIDCVPNEFAYLGSPNSCSVSMQPSSTRQRRVLGRQVTIPRCSKNQMVFVWKSTTCLGRATSIRVSSYHVAGQSIERPRDGLFWATRGSGSSSLTSTIWWSPSSIRASTTTTMRRYRFALFVVIAPFAVLWIIASAIVKTFAPNKEGE